MKSAYELALSKLEKSSPTVKLTAEQKARIADIDSLHRSRIAEKRLMLESEIEKNAGQPAEQEMLKRQLASEITRLEEESESKKEEVRRG